MMRYRLLLFFLLSNILGIAQNQTAIDSLLQLLKTDISDRDRVDIYVDIARNYRESNFKKVNTYGNRAIALANKIDYTEGTIDVLYYLGGAALNQEKLPEAEQFFSKMLALAINNNNKASAKAYYGLGRVSKKMGQTDKALEYLFESLKIS